MRRHLIPTSVWGHQPHKLEYFCRCPLAVEYIDTWLPWASNEVRRVVIEKVKLPIKHEEEVRGGYRSDVGVPQQKCVDS